MKLAFVDHYDSFSFNVMDWLHAAGETAGFTLDFVYCPYDDRIAMEDLARQKLPTVLSPGPGHPHAAQPTLDLINELWNVVPMFGICLGLQCLAVARGGVLKSAAHIHHGSVRKVQICKNDRVFGGIGPDIEVATYNSLCVDQGCPILDLEIAAIDDQGDIQAMESPNLRTPLIAGVQFHPESFLSEDVSLIFKNWLNLSRKT